MNDNQPIDKITALLRKVKALAERGVDGEREAAEAKLRELMDRYGLTPEAIMSTERKPVLFYYETGSKSILVNILCEVLDRSEISIRPASVGKGAGMWVELSPAEAADATAMWKHYRRIYRQNLAELRKQIKVLDSSIIAKFNIGSTSEDDHTQSVEQSPEELARLIKVLRGLEGERYQREFKQLEDRP